MHEPQPEPDDLEGQLTVTSSTHAHAIVVAAAGEIDVLTAPRLSAALEPALHHAAADNVIVCDLTGVTFLASHGIELLLRATEQAQEMRRTLRVVITPSQVNVSRSLELTGVDRVLALYPSLDEAVNGQH
ncbi:MAG TPA: STAS domain-containing protein [Pseudonocardiaceae bacterium]|nr:STAS domain-containing protein [Pseudonocardiaceae bacterium]